MRRAWLLAALAASLGCRAPRVVHHDLAAAAFASEHASSVTLLRLGAPDAEPARGGGLLRAVSPEAGARAKHDAEAFVSLPDLRPRSLLLDFTNELEGQQAELRFNGVALSSLVLAVGRRRYLVGIPAAAQQVGRNALAFRFSQVARRPGELRVAATLHSLAIAAEGATVLEDLMARGAPPPFDVVTAEGAPGIELGLPGTLRSAFELPRRAELRFTPGLHAAAAKAGARVEFRVLLEGAGGERELWSSRLGPQDLPGEQVLALPGAPGSAVRLSLETRGEGRLAFGRWLAPRVLGSAPAPPAWREPQAEADRARGAALRQRLAGVNVLLVVLDAARAGSFGAYGHGRRTTPEIDRIASEGVVFEQASSAAVYTLASMASIWTSRYPDEVRAGRVHAESLPSAPLTLAERLGAAGIHAAGFTANGIAGPAFGLQRGFAEYAEVFRGNPSNEADVFRLELWPWLEANRGRRFFAYAHVREPHFPYDPRPPYDTLFGPDGPIAKPLRKDKQFLADVDWGGRGLTPPEAEHLARLYDGNLAFADHEVGALRQKLEQLGLWDDTVLILTADHGEALFEHGYVGHNHQLYEASVRIPLIVRFPKGRGPAGRRIAAPVEQLDIAPTILECFGIEKPEAAFAGWSLLPLIEGAPGKRAAFARTVGERPIFGIRDARYKLLFDSARGTFEFYDRAVDPDERSNRNATDVLQAAAYRARLFRWILAVTAGERGESQAPSLAPEQQENLRALGYVN
jgi:arylsulfatase A-like enzyme